MVYQLVQPNIVFCCSKIDTECVSIPSAKEITSPLKVALFDHKILPTNPVGGCHLRMLRGLCHQHDFTVFAVEFENPCPERIRWVRVPAPSRPLALLYVVYHLLAPICYWAYRVRYRVRFDLVQMVESNLSFGNVSYSHFCHRAYLKYHWKQSRPGGLRRWFRWLDHWLHALVEPRTYRRARYIVVPSRGLATELAAEYPYAQSKIRVIPNPVDVNRMRPSEDFDREAFRSRLGITPDELGLAFVALGHFERKGLPLLLKAISGLGTKRLKLVVVGGTNDLLAGYRQRVQQMGLADQVVFVGMQRDVRPYLWAADAFTLPSLYEVFPLVALEAAAAGLPLIVTPLNGVEEFLRDGDNGILVERSSGGVARGISRLLAMPPEARRVMGQTAQRDVQRYATENFVAGWRAFYEGLSVG